MPADIRSFFSKKASSPPLQIAAETSKKDFIAAVKSLCWRCNASSEIKDNMNDGGANAEYMCDLCKTQDKVVEDDGHKVEEVFAAANSPPRVAEVLMETVTIETKSIETDSTIPSKKRDKFPLTTPKPKRPKKVKPCAETVPKLTASHFHPKDPRLAKLSLSDVKMVSKRRLRDKQDDVPYDIELVPPALGCSVKSLVSSSSLCSPLETENVASPFSGMLKESVLLKVEGQEGWTCTEMLQLCSEASWRRVLIDRERNPDQASHVTADPKPLTLEYICDRLDTDDPIYGYQVRHASTGWLQGFITYTVFTTWSPYFRFDSKAASCGITADDYEHRAVDKSGEVALALQREKRWGDPAEEGIVFEKVAEVSLLGGLGCGAWLLCLTLEEMRSKGFNWVVLQATDQAIPFYENMGFVRVGCVARHPSKEEEEEEQVMEKKPVGSESNKKKKTNKKEDKAPKKIVKKIASQPALHDGSPTVPSDCPPEDRYYWLAMWMIHLVTTWKLLDYEAIFTVPVSLEEVPNYKDFIPHEPIDLSLMQRKAVDFRYPHLAALVSDLHKLVDNALAFNGKASPIALLAKSLRTKALASVRKLMLDEPEVSHASRNMSPVTWPSECWLFQPPNKQSKQSLESSDDLSHDQSERTSNSPKSAERYQNGESSSHLDIESEKKTSAVEVAVEDEEAVFCDENQMVDDRPPMSAQEREDAEHYQWLQSEEGQAFTLRMNQAADKDKNVLGYVHWTFPDQTVEDQYPSYMMARRLNPSPSVSSSCSTTTVDVSPEVAAGFPRGVTPRGDAFVAKFTSASTCDYLGTFPSIREAKVSYLEAKTEYDAATSAQEASENRSVKPPPACDTLLQHVNRWLVEEPPTITPKRMAHVKGASADSSEEQEAIGSNSQMFNMTDDDCSATATMTETSPCQAATEQVMGTTQIDTSTDSQSFNPIEMNNVLPTSKVTSVISSSPTSTPNVITQPISNSKEVAPSKKSKKKPVREKLYNKLVMVEDQPPCYPYKYWFVYQYVPDMEWCHLCPVEQVGLFKTGKRQGRPRFKLVPEGRAREIDIPASRCRLIKTEQCVHTSSADQEIFDIIDDSL